MFFGNDQDVRFLEHVHFLDRIRLKKFRSIHLDQSQKQARGLKFWLEMKDDLFYPSSENKGVGQLSSYRTADLRLCFRLRILVVCSGSFSNYLKAIAGCQ